MQGKLGVCRSSRRGGGAGGCRASRLPSSPPFWFWGFGGLRPKRTRGGRSAVDFLFSASCSNLYADTEAPESSDSLCRSMCSLFVDAAVPVGWGRACRHQLCCTAGSRALRLRTEQTYNRLFPLLPDVGSKETTHPPTAPEGTSSWVQRILGSNTVFSSRALP